MNQQSWKNQVYMKWLIIQLKFYSLINKENSINNYGGWTN